MLPEFAVERAPRGGDVVATSASSFICARDVRSACRFFPILTIPLFTAASSAAISASPSIPPTRNSGTASPSFLFHPRDRPPTYLCTPLQVTNPPPPPLTQFPVSLITIRFTRFRELTLVGIVGTQESAVTGSDRCAPWTPTRYNLFAFLLFCMFVTRYDEGYGEFVIREG